MPVVTRSVHNVRRAAMGEARILSECCRLEEICAICHDDICGSDVYHLPCGHTFHKECLRQQLRHGRQWATKCAVCRAEHRDAILENPELSQHLSETVDQNQDQDENFENSITTFMLPHLNNINGQQYTMEWSADEGGNGHQLPNVEDITNNNNLSPELVEAVLIHLIQHIGHASEQDDGNMGIEPESDLPSLAGTEEQETGSNVETDILAPEGESYDSEDYDFAPHTWSGTFSGTLDVLLATDSASEIEDDSSTNDISSIETNED